jgi:hypothetical protein
MLEGRFDRVVLGAARPSLASSLAGSLKWGRDLGLVPRLTLVGVPPHAGWGTALRVVAQEAVRRGAASFSENRGRLGRGWRRGGGGLFCRP